MIAEYAPYVMAALLVLAFLIEIRTGRIPNWLSLIPFVMFLGVLVMADDRGPLYTQMFMAAGVFSFGIIMFIIGGMGAGAVKLMTGTVLFIPVSKAFYTLLIFLPVFFVSTFVFIKIRKWFGSEDSDWHLMANAVLPLSFSIGVAGIAGLFFLP